MPEVFSYENLDDEELRMYLIKKAEVSREVVTIETLDKLIDDELRISKTGKDSCWRIESLFPSYKLLLRRNSSASVTKDNKKIVVYHILSAILPDTHQARFESDLELFHNDLRKDFTDFINHTIKFSEGFQPVDIVGPFPRKRLHLNRDGSKGSKKEEVKKTAETKTLLPLRSKKKEKSSSGTGRVSTNRAFWDADIRVEVEKQGQRTCKVGVIWQTSIIWR